jgi:alpha-2-macroglobulin
MKFTFSLVFTLVLMTIIYSCGSKHAKIVSVDPKFRNYVAAYSSGMQSRAQEIRIELQELVDSVLLEKHGDAYFKNPKFLSELVQISPSTPGKVRWKNERVLEFVPDKPLPSSTLFTISVDLEKIVQVESGYETFVFQVATYEQKMDMKGAITNTLDNYNLEWCYVEGAFETTDLADSANIQKVISAEYMGKKVKVEIEEGNYYREYRYRIDSLLRQEKEGELIIKWDGEPIQSKSKGTKTVKIPSVHDFELIEWTVEDNDDQIVLLTFSEPIKSDQELNGLIEIEGLTNLNYSVSFNLVRLFLPNRIVGERKLKVSSGIKNIKNYTMENSFAKTLVFYSQLPRIRIKGEGSILPDSKGLIFPFETIALKSVTVRIQKIYENNVHHFLQVNNLNGNDELLRFGKKITEKKVDLKIPKDELQQWTQHVLNLEKWIRPEQGAIYRIGIKFNRDDAECNCSAEELVAGNDGTDDEIEEEDDWSEDTWDSYYWDSGYDNWSDYNSNESPCLKSYYRGKAISRNILASNIGIIFKLDEDKKTHAFLTNMLTSEPLANAEINYMDYTKQLISSGTTDASGMLTMTLPRKPFLLVAKYGSQRGYLKLGDGYSNSMSKFDVDGEFVQNEIKGYIYGERGVWRPGDSLYLNFVLQDQMDKIPANHPVKFTLTNPNNQVVDEITTTSSINNHYDFRTATLPNAPTGIYQATVSIGKREFIKWLKVETVKPNRLKMKLNFSEDNPEDSIELVSSWLHGAPAKNLKAEVGVEFKPEKTTFEGYKGYEFDSPIRTLKSNSVVAFHKELNDEGKGKFKMRSNDFSDAPGMLKAIYTTRVFEKGGNYSIDRMSRPFSPFKNYVGLGIPNTGDESLLNGKNHVFPIVSLDEKGKKQSKSTKMRVKIYRMEWRWWYEENDDEQVNFLGRNGNMVVFDTTFLAQNGESKFNFGLSKHDYGRFMIIVTDEVGGHQTGKIIRIDYPYWSRANNRTNEFASMLNFSCDKQSYIKGEMVKVNFPSPAVGKALVSIETRKRVIKKYWVNTVKGETSTSFEATADMAPNAFVHLTMIQPHSSTVNDLPIRMYGVVPILVDDPNTHLHPILAVDKQWRPETQASIGVSEKSGTSMTYTLAIVDDGLLDLTRFKTPNPWHTFFAKEALGVKTWDMYNDVIGAYSGKLDRLLSIGGDGEADDGAGPKANRFKPMVHFLGPFVLPAGRKKNHKIDLPAYIGSVRVMVVAHNEKSYGSTEETVLIKKPLMVLGTLPRVIGPGETIQLPVNVFAMENFIKAVDVEVSTNEFLSLTKGKTQKLYFDQIGDDMAYFEMKVSEQIGIAKIKINVRSGKESAAQEFEVDVRSPNPVTVESQTLILEPGKSAQIPIPADGIKGSHRLSVEMSATPAINLNGRLSELIHYPYGCIEQTTSTLFPQLLALEVMDCSAEEKKEMEKNIRAGLLRYLSFQVSQGGFAYWPGDNEASDWGSNYAGHFILVAEEHGYALPTGMKNRWIEYQEDLAKKWENDGSYIPHNRATESHQLIQAYRLYTLALAGKPDLSSMNRLRETAGLKSIAKWRLAAAYHLAGQTEVAQQMIAGLTFKTDVYSEYSYTYGSGLRDKAMILEACQMIDCNRSKSLVDEVASEMTSPRWLSTQETGYCLIALTSNPSRSKTRVKGQILNLGGANYTLEGSKRQSVISFKEKTMNGAKNFTVKNNGSNRLYVTTALEKVAKRGFEKSENSGLNISVFYKDLEGKKIDPTKLIQGTDFIVEVHLFNPNNKTLYKEMSLQHIFPSGWEVHNTRFMEGAAQDVFNLYQDIRDDRVNTFFDLAPHEKKTIKIQLNASYKGRFYVPGIYSEAMYKRSVHAQEKGYWAEVF